MLDLRLNRAFDCCDSVITEMVRDTGGGGVNRSELIHAVARELALTKREAEAAVGAVIGNIVDEVRSGRRVFSRRVREFQSHPQSGKDRS